MKLAGDLFKISTGFERLFFFIFSSCLLIHIFACLWIFFSKLEEKNEDSWYYNLKDKDLYLTSIYFTITTFSTVGYGDISG